MKSYSMRINGIMCCRYVVMMMSHSLEEWFSYIFEIIKHEIK